MFFPAAHFKVIIAGMELTVFYIAILFLISVIDIRRQKVLNSLALPTLLVALIASAVEGRAALWQAFAGAAAGFLFFYTLFSVGTRMFQTKALGFGDVKLAMLLGAMVGLDQIMPVLAYGMLMAGLAAIVLLLTRKAGRGSSLPYGAFLAAAGIGFLLLPLIDP